MATASTIPGRTVARERWGENATTFDSGGIEALQHEPDHLTDTGAGAFMGDIEDKLWRTPVIVIVVVLTWRRGVGAADHRWAAVGRTRRRPGPVFFRESHR